jgi:hypothetical protein
MSTRAFPCPYANDCFPQVSLDQSAVGYFIDHRHGLLLLRPAREPCEEHDLVRNLHRTQPSRVSRFCSSMTCLFLALSCAGTKYDFDNPIVLCLYAAFTLLLALFIWDQHRGQDATTIPPRIFEQRSIIGGVSDPLGIHSFLMRTLVLTICFSSSLPSATAPATTWSSTTCPHTSRLCASTLQRRVDIR